MKTIDYLRHYIPVVTFSLILVASALDAGAEDHHKKESRSNEHERDRREYRSSDRHHEATAQNEWHGNKNRNLSKESYDHYGNHNEYHPKYYSNHHHYSKPDYFIHPKYGRVYHRFEHNPIVFETNCGNYYYSENNFYRYHDGIGYCVTELPRQIYFRHLPYECRRVYLNGEVFFSNGNLFFQYSPKGYVLVPSPLEIRITARF